MFDGLATIIVGAIIVGTVAGFVLGFVTAKYLA